MMTQGFRTYELALDLYAQCKKVSTLSPYLKDQLTRASSSICLNLAEGSAKPTERDRRKYYHTALGSLREVQAVIRIERASVGELYDLADKLGAHLYRLCKS